MAASLPAVEPASGDRVWGEPAPSGKKPKAIGGGVLLAMLLSSALFASASGLFYFWSVNQLNVAQQQHFVAVEAMDRKVAAEERAAEIEKVKEAEVAAADAAASAAARQKANDAIRDKAYTDAGWDVTVADGIYFASMAGEYFCTTNAPSCAVFNIVTDEPCMAGVFVSVSMLRDEVSFEGVSGISAGLPAGGQALMELGASSDFDTYLITDIYCLG